jgi:hypothetical protein
MSKNVHLDHIPDLEEREEIRCLNVRGLNNITYASKDELLSKKIRDLTENI